MKKKIGSIAATAILTATILFAGCNSTNTTQSEAAAPESGTTAANKNQKTYKIGIIQLAENGAFNEMRQGFLDRMNELGYTEDFLDVDYKNAAGDMGTLNTICQEMAKSGKDLVVSIATPASQAYVNQGSDIPLIFISVSNPVAAGIMSALDTPDQNATGTSNMIPVDEIFKMAKELTPSATHYGILYNTGETNSVNTVADAKAYMDENGYTYEDAIVTNSSEIQQSAQALASKVDAIYIPNDSMIQSAMPQVADIAKDAGIPVYGSSPVMVQSGAFATVSTDDTEIGAASADIAHQYFGGTNIVDIPAVVLKNYIVVINKTTADKIGVEIPESYSDAILID